MIAYEIMTPESMSSSGSAVMVVVPGVEGYMGFLKNHAPIVSPLLPGIVRVYSSAETIEKEFFVSGGVVRMVNNLCSILAAEVLPLASLTMQYVDERLTRAQEALSLAESMDEKKEAEEEYAIACAMKNWSSQEK